MNTRKSSERGAEMPLRQMSERPSLLLSLLKNGQVKAKSMVNGVLTPEDTSEIPLTEVETYKADQAELPMFLAVVQRLYDRVRSARQWVRE